MSLGDNHPLAYWLWALGLVVALARTPDFLATAILIASAAVVVRNWRAESPWASAFEKALVFASIIFTIRVLIGIAFTIPTPGETLFTLPRLELPNWVAGIGVGGPVTSERLLSAINEGAVICGVIALTGAAVSMSQPRRLLKQIPGALHEAGVVLVIASTFVPQLIASIQRVRQARHLRGHTGSAWRGTAIPVLEDALERATSLAMAMESRGYGRVATIAPGRARSTHLLMLGALAALLVGAFGLLAAGDGLSLTITALGIVGALVALQRAGERTLRTKYFVERWSQTSILFVGCGVLTALLSIFGLLGPFYIGLLTAALPAAVRKS